MNRRTEIVILGSLKEGNKDKDCGGFYNAKENEMAIALTEGEFGEKIQTLSSVYFDFNSYNLNITSRKSLEDWSKNMLKYNHVKIEIEGHTDGVGSDAYNKLLSENRVNSVKKYLISAGVASDRIITKSYGKSKLIAANNTEEGRKKNRRVDIALLN